MPPTRGMEFVPSKLRRAVRPARKCRRKPTSSRRPSACSARHVRRRAADRQRQRGPRFGFGVQQFSQPEIGHLGNKRKLLAHFERLIVARTQTRLEQDVGRLEIAVDDSAGVRVRDGRRQLAHQFGRQPRGNRERVAAGATPTGWGLRSTPRRCSTTGPPRPRRRR